MYSLIFANSCNPEANLKLCHALQCIRAKGFPVHLHLLRFDNNSSHAFSIMFLSTLKNDALNKCFMLWIRCQWKAYHSGALALMTVYVIFVLFVLINKALQENIVWDCISKLNENHIKQANPSSPSSRCTRRFSLSLHFISHTFCFTTSCSKVWDNT